MTAEEEEQYLKKKLQAFLSELVKVGTVKGFQHFAMYMRGREELVISVVNSPASPDNSYCQSPVSPQTPHVEGGDTFPDFSQDRRISDAGSSFSSSNLPYDKRSLMLSQRTQRSLSGYGDIGVGLPPASPSELENSGDENATLFLLAGYGRYNSPYVWVRSNHERIVRMTGDKDDDRDNPLKLKSTSRWLEHDVMVWDILAELVKLCTYPPPLNPFAVDFTFFDNLPLQERFLATAAMANCLQKVMVSNTKHMPYTTKVLEDLQKITTLHFQDLQTLCLQNQIPAINRTLPQQSPSPTKYAQKFTATANSTNLRQSQQANTYATPPDSRQSSSSTNIYRKQPGSPTASKYTYRYHTDMF